MNENACTEILPTGCDDDLPDITDEQLIETVKAVAAEAPFTVYTAPEHMSTTGACFYAHTDAVNRDELSPGCLIGVALHRLGVPLETLAEHEDINARIMLGKLYPKLDNDTVDFANFAQAEQDKGVPWGTAVERAERYIWKGAKKPVIDS